jgi:hypothetical protein
MKKTDRRRIAAATIILGGLTATGVILQRAVVKASGSCEWSDQLHTCLGTNGCLQCHWDSDLAACSCC